MPKKEIILGIILIYSVHHDQGARNQEHAQECLDALIRVHAFHKIEIQEHALQHFPDKPLNAQQKVLALCHRDQVDQQEDINGNVQGIRDGLIRHPEFTPNRSEEHTSEL